MESPKPGLTQPDICREAQITRARAERILFEYRDRFPAFYRVGITRVWPPEILAQIRMIVAEEDRLRERGR